MSIKLKKIVEGIQWENNSPKEEEKKILSKEEKKELLEIMSRFNEIGAALRHDVNLLEISEKLTRLADLSEAYVMNENSDAFDGVTIKRNFASMRKLTEEFNKTAKEAHAYNQRTEALWEEIGTIASRYFDIKE